MAVSVHKRYFRITKGPVVDEIDRLQDLRQEAGKLYAELAKKYGATQANTWDHSGVFAGFSFDETPDQEVFRLLKKHRIWLPRKNTPAGKAVWAEIDKMPTPEPVANALKLVGLTPNVPCLLTEGRWYAPTVWGNGQPISIWFVSVPWQEIDPEVMEQYKRDRAAGGRCDSNLEHLQWEAPADWVEVKEWQILKEAEEIEAARKAQEAA